MSDPDRVAEMLRALKARYLANLPETLDELEDLVAATGERGADTRSKLVRQVHTLKGTAGTYGGMIITNVCHQYEDVLVEASSRRLDDATLRDLGLGYVRAMRLAHRGLEAGQDRFPEVEAELEALKRQLSPARREVMLVLPSRAVATLVTSVLEGLPLQLVRTDSGLVALQRLLHERFDLLITGLTVPELAGPALIGALRLSGGVNEAIKTVVVSSSALPDLPEVARPDLAFRVGAALDGMRESVATLLGIPPTPRDDA